MRIEANPQAATEKMFIHKNPIFRCGFGGIFESVHTFLSNDAGQSVTLNGSCDGAMIIVKWGDIALTLLTLLTKILFENSKRNGFFNSRERYDTQCSPKQTKKTFGSIGPQGVT